MKRLINSNSMIWMMAVAATLAVAPAWALELKIGVVDYARLLDQSPEGGVIHAKALRGPGVNKKPRRPLRAGGVSLNSVVSQSGV